MVLPQSPPLLPLDRARAELLDLTLRNPLLNMSAKRGVWMAGVQPQEVFRLLVVDRRTLGIIADQEAAPARPSRPRRSTAERVLSLAENETPRPSPTPAPETVASTDPRPAVPGAVRPPQRVGEEEVRALLNAIDLQRRLGTLSRDARTFLEERGVNVLYLALGVLRWYDADSSKEAHQAPLLLVPMALERTARDQFRLRYTDEPIVDNLSLAKKLNDEFAIHLPALREGDKADEDIDPGLFFSRVVAAVAAHPRWALDTGAAVLSLFSFTKFAMYRDLDAAVWPPDQSPTAHPLLQAALGQGFHEPLGRLSEADMLDAHLPAQQSYQITDADSSQILALLDVGAGRNLVIQGPPGTGKSQTITNLIADALGAGKTVLFVAEKMAALEVVKRRLDALGLGQVCLELHSNKTSKQALLTELKRTRDLERPPQKAEGGAYHALDQQRAGLNAYVEALHQPIGGSGVSPYQAMGALLQLWRRYDRSTLRDLAPTHMPMAAWTTQAFAEQRALVQELQDRLRDVGTPHDHPFWGSGRTVFSPTEEGRLRQTLREAQVAVAALDMVGETLAALLHKPTPTTAADVQALAGQWWRTWSGTHRAARAQRRTAVAQYQAALQTLGAMLEFDPQVRFGTSMPLADQPFALQTALLTAWTEQLATLDTLVAYNYVAARCQAAGWGALLPLVATWPEGAHRLIPSFEQAWYAGLIEAALGQRPALAGFRHTSHEQGIRLFCTLDTTLFLHNRERLALAHWEQMPRQEAGGQLGILTHEFNKRRRHRPIRQLLTEAGAAVQRIKPVFMMSPLSIATYLAPGSLTFDLVIFDEASQVTPVEAFGALLRGKHVVVVGDSKQLPPSNFFDVLAGEEQAEEEEHISRDVESVLTLFLAQRAPERMLRWHYRSQHESLIAVSNQEFYDNRLIVFPNPAPRTPHLGLHFHHLPQAHYDRGHSHTNRGEAQVVAKAIMRHAQEHADQTLGVAAFSQAQALAIDDALAARRQRDPASEAFFAAHPQEPFFIKNLETVQGDERDVILISIGYGRDEHGHLHMNFGPLNQAGGERRLNVLITRARQRCEVFSNLTAGDIDLRASGARGVAALKLFLEYAEHRTLSTPQPSGRAPDSPFEEAVLASLRERGYQVEPQVGSAGFSIDLAVVDPDQPGHYLLGIECDGATYHSARSARDRDRLRQQVLEKLGWRIHRIWSTDWFRNPGRELERVVAAINAAQAAAPPSLVATEVELLPTERVAVAGLLEELSPAAAPAAPSAPPPHRTPSAPPYRMATLQVNTNGQPFHLVSGYRLAEWVEQIVRVEGPVHMDEVGRRIREAAGVARTGSRIEEALQEGIRNAVVMGEVTQRGAFLWLPNQAVPLRDRSGLPAALRKADLIAPEELAQAVIQVVRDACGMIPKEISEAVAQLLGVRPVRDPLRLRVDAQVAQLRQAGILVAQGAFLRVEERNKP